MCLSILLQYCPTLQEFLNFIFKNIIKSCIFKNIVNKKHYICVYVHVYMSLKLIRPETMQLFEFLFI